MSKKVAVWLMIVIMSLATINIFIWSEQKDGFHCDEIYSHGLSNTDFHYKVHDENGNIRWNTPEDIKGYMVVSEEGKFNYKNVIDNQIEDVHPPLFYFIMHTISSFMPGKYSIYVCIIPNILFSLGTAVFLYFIVMKILKKRSLALIAMLCYLFSINCINIATYMRMYALMTFFSMVITYLHIRFIENDCILTKKMAVAMFTTIFLGALTQYYFLIFMFGVALYTVIYINPKAERKKFFDYFKLMSITAGIYILIWPWVFKHMFIGGRGGEAFGNAVITSLTDNIKGYLELLNIGVGGLMFVVFAISVILCVVWCINRDRLKISELSKVIRKKTDIMFLIFVSVFYFLIISKIAPFQTDRYIASIFPLFVVIVIYIVNKTLSVIFGISEKIKTLIILVCVVFSLPANIKDVLYKPDACEKNNNYLFRIPEENEQLWAEYGGKKCVMITSKEKEKAEKDKSFNSNEWQFLRNLPDYKNYSETAFVSANEIDKLIGDEHLKGEEGFVLYVNRYLDTNKTAREIQEKLGFDSFKQVLWSNSRNYADVYYIYNE